MSFPLINPSHQFFDSSGDPLVSGTIEFQNPTTAAKINTYPTADDADAQTNANANPLTLDSRGGFTGIYLEDGVPYKFILKNSAAVTQDTQDDVLCPSGTKTNFSQTAQTLTDAGAVSITTSTTFIVTTGAAAITLADGAENQQKYIVMKTDAGAATLTPANFANGTTLVFDDVGDSALLMFMNASWHWIGGTARGASIPVTDQAASATNALVWASGVNTLDTSSLTTIAATALAGADTFLVDDGAGGTNKTIAFQDFGVTQVDDTGTTPLSAADLTFANKIYNCNNAGSIAAVIPANASIAYPVGTVLGFTQIGAGQVTVTVTTDALNAASGTKTRAQWSTIYARKTAAAVWVMSGDTTT